MKKIVFAFMFLCLFIVGCGSEEIYKVDFIANGEVVYSQEVVKGQNVDLPKSPEMKGYEFIGWDKECTSIQENLEVNALFEKIKYNIKYYIDDIEVSLLPNEFDIDSGQITLPIDIKKEGYEFIGWKETKTSDENIITSFSSNDLENKSFAAIFKKIEPVKYNVIFNDGFGNVISTQVVEKGNDAVLPSIENNVGYIFKGWNVDTKNVISDLEVYAMWELVNYTIKYMDGEEELLGLSPNEYNIESSASINLPEPPEKEGYEFIGWYSGGTRVVTFFSSDAENKVFEAQYQKKEVTIEKKLELPNDADFLFTNIKKIPHGSGNGTYVFQPDFTGLDVPSTSATEYEWSSLNPEVVTISQWSSISVVSPGYAIIKASLMGSKKFVGYAVVKVNADGVFISSIEEANTKKTYTVKFADSNGQVFDTQVVEEGKTAILPTPPVKQGYTFVGWNKAHFNIQADVIIQPKYKKGISDFVGKKVSILGDSISTFKGYVPNGYPCFYPYPTADFGDVNQTWWMQVINNLGMSLLKNNSYSGSCVSSGTGDSSTVTDSRLIELVDGNKKPDIILLFMGSNDCGSKYVSLDTFASSYKTMIEKIQVLCPDTEIYLFTLPCSNLYTEENRVLYNEVIRKYATDFSLNLIELNATFTVENCSDYLLDSAHHNKEGMEKLSKSIINEMLKIKGIK